MIAYTVLVDTAQDGTYATDISAYVVRFETRYGLEMYGHIGRDAFASLTLLDRTGEFSRDNVSAALYDVLAPGNLIKISGSYDVLDETLFIGRLISVMSEPDTATVTPLVTATIEGWAQVLTSTYVQPRLLENVRVDEAIATLFDEYRPIRAPHPARYTLVGAAKVGFAKVSPNPDLLELDEAKTTLAYAGDVVYDRDSGRELPMLGYIEQLVKSEAGGRFFYQPRSGKFIFHSRKRDSIQTLKATFDANYSAGAMEYGRDIGNVVRVDYETRSVGVGVEALGRLENVPLQLASDVSRNFRIRYEDGASVSTRVFGKDIIEPVRGLDVIANTEADGSGADVSANLIVRAELGAAGADITLRQESGTPIFVTKLEIRGTAIRATVDSVTVGNAVSGQLYGRFERVFSLPVVDNALFANSFAVLKSEQFGTARPIMPRLGMVAATHGNRQKALTVAVGDLVRVIEPRSGHDAEYIVIAENHTVDIGSGRHDVEYGLQLAARMEFAVVGTAKVGFAKVAF